MKKRMLVFGIVALLLMTAVVSAKSYEDMTLEKLEIRQDKIETKSDIVYNKLQIEIKPKKIAKLTARLDKLDSKWAEIDMWIRIKTPPVCNHLGCEDITGGSW